MRIFACSNVADHPMPDGFGSELKHHIERPENPELRRASLSAWCLLFRVFRSCCDDPFPEVAFSERGKPFFVGSSLFFSLSHSGGLCAVSLADTQTGADIERLRRRISPSVVRRTLNDAERAVYDGDFIRLWCRKESIAKLTGQGITFHPDSINTLDPSYSFAELSLLAGDRSEYRAAAAFMGTDEDIDIIIDQGSGITLLR